METPSARLSFRLCKSRIVWQCWLGGLSSWWACILPVESHCTSCGRCPLSKSQRNGCSARSADLVHDSCCCTAALMMLARQEMVEEWMADCALCHLLRNIGVRIAGCCLLIQRALYSGSHKVTIGQLCFCDRRRVLCAARLCVSSMVPSECELHGPTKGSRTQRPSLLG